MFVLLIHGSFVMQDGVQKCRVNPDGSIVADEAKFLNLFMKKLTRDRVEPIISASVSWLTSMSIGGGFFAEIRQQQQHARQAFFTRIEKLVDKVFLDTAVSRNQVHHKQLNEFRLDLEHPCHCFLGYAPARSAS